MRYAFTLLSVCCFVAGCLGRTPDGDRANHQFFLGGLCLALAIAFWREHLRVKKDLDDMDI